MASLLQQTGSDEAGTHSRHYSNEALLGGIDAEILLDVASQWYDHGDISCSLLNLFCLFASCFSHIYHLYLCRWSRHNNKFNLFWLTISENQRKEMLTGLLPDTAEETSECIKPSDILLPELNMNAMLGNSFTHSPNHSRTHSLIHSFIHKIAVNGKILSLFMLRRLVELNVSYQKDVELLMKEYSLTHSLTHILTYLLAHFLTLFLSYF